MDEVDVKELLEKLGQVAHSLTRLDGHLDYIGDYVYRGPDLGEPYYKYKMMTLDTIAKHMHQLHDAVLRHGLRSVEHCEAVEKHQTAVSTHNNKVAKALTSIAESLAILASAKK